MISAAMLRLHLYLRFTCDFVVASLTPTSTSTLLLSVSTTKHQVTHHFPRPCLLQTTTLHVSNNFKRISFPPPRHHQPSNNTNNPQVPYPSTSTIASQLTSNPLSPAHNQQPTNSNPISNRDHASLNQADGIPRPRLAMLRHGAKGISYPPFSPQFLPLSSSFTSSATNAQKHRSTTKNSANSQTSPPPPPRANSCA